MSRFTGKDLYVKFGSTVLTADHRTFDVDETADQIDATAGADTRKVYLAGLIDGKASMSLLGTSGGTTDWAAVTPQTSGTLEWGPEGTTGGKPKFTCGTALVLGRKTSYPYNDVVSYDINWALSGAVAGGTY